MRSIVLRLSLVAAAPVGGCGDGTSAEDGSIAGLYSATVRWLVVEATEGEWLVGAGVTMSG